MKISLIIAGILMFSLGSYAQKWQQASLSDDNTIKVKWVSPPDDLTQSKSTLTQMTGFPVAVTGNATFKNMRNLALADINGDQVQDIVFVADSKLYVYSYQGIIWQQTIIGTGIYPPSVADINNDGFQEIVLLTGGIPANGRIYAFDKDGNTLPGWPVNFSSHWMMCAPALADVDNDNVMEIIACERYTSTVGRVHVLKTDGTTFSGNWPVTLDGVPAVTPSVGDVDNDGEKEIVAYSTKSKYIFKLDGQPETGFPVVTEPGQKYSYQSPVIADFNNDDQYEVTGSTHGDLPQYYVMNNDGSNYTGWPVTVPDSSWTYSTPAVVKINNEWRIFMSRPIGETPEDMLYCWDAAGNMRPGFPIIKSGGLEGYISVADINNDATFELVFGANMLDSTGCGFIYAYNAEDGSAINGFPIRPRGWTFMNGVCIGDVNGDALMDLVSLTYTNSFGAYTDTVYINVYETDSPYSPEKVLWETYKGSNDRCGFIWNGITHMNDEEMELLSVYPNPGNGFINISIPGQMFSKNCVIEVFDLFGKKLCSFNVTGNITSIDMGRFPAGVYMIKAGDTKRSFVKRIILKK